MIKKKGRRREKKNKMTQGQTDTGKEGDLNKRGRKDRK